MNGSHVHKSTSQQVNIDDAPPVVGAVLAGGKSSRMGQPKHALSMRDGRMMIEHVVDAMRAVCDDVVIIGPDDVLPGLPHVHDRRADCGPLAGIEALLLRDINAPEAATQTAPKSAKGRVSGVETSQPPQHYLICPCDLPRITGDLLQRLCIQTDKPVTLFHIEGRDAPDPLPMRISIEALPTVQECLDNERRSVQSLLEHVQCRAIEIDGGDAAQLRNVNTMVDFQRLEE